MRRRIANKINLQKITGFAIAVNAVQIVCALAERNRERGEVHAAGQFCNEGSEEIIDDAGDDSGERGTDDNADGHVDDVALERKLLEFLNNLSHDDHPPYKNTDVL